VWDRKPELVEESYSERLEERGSHVRKKGFQESTDTPEKKRAEVRMGDMYHDRSIQQLPLDVTIWNRGLKANVELLQLGKE
jgi:hypothetical protein